MTVAEKAVFGVLLAAIGLAALYKLPESPSVWYDEGLYIQESRNIATQGVYGLQLAPGEFLPVQLSVGFPLNYPVAFSFNLLGYGILEARLTMVLFIVCFTLVAFALVRALYGSTVALWALALLALFPPLYANGKSVLGEVPGILFVSLSLLLVHLARTEVRHRRWYAAAAGVCVGLACVTKPVFILLLPALAFVAWRERARLVGEKQLLTYGVSVFFLPLVAWVATQFSHNDTLALPFSFYLNPYAVSMESLWRMVGTNALHLVTDVGPLFLTGMLLVWSLALLFRRTKGERTPPEEWVAYVFCIISTIAYLRTGGFYRYLFPYQAIAILFFPAALESVISEVVQTLRAPRVFSRAGAWICAVLVCLNGYQLLYNSWVADFYTSTKTATWEAYFASLPGETSVFFYNTPEVAVFMRSNRYYQYITPLRDPTVIKDPTVMQWGRQELQVLHAGIPDIVVIETRLLEGAQSNLAHYTPSGVDYGKYTILNHLR